MQRVIIFLFLFSYTLVFAGGNFDALNITDGTFTNVKLKTTGETWIFNAGKSNNDFVISGTTETNLFRVDANTNKIGIGIATPEVLLHLVDGTAGTVTATTEAELALEDDADVGLQFLSPAANAANIYFGDSDSVSIGRIKYDHSNDSLGIYTNSTEAAHIDSSGHIGIGYTSTTYPFGVYNTTTNEIYTQIINADTGTGSTRGVLLGMNASEEAILKNQENTDLIMYTNNVELARFNSDNQIELGISQEIIVRDDHYLEFSCPSAIATPEVSSRMLFWVNESTHKLMVRVKYSNGNNYSAEVCTLTP